jgi:proliferating cell nuclear antigen
MSSTKKTTTKTTAEEEEETEELQFSSITKTPEMWKSVSSAIMTIVEEAHFEASQEGLRFRSMDPSHVALIDINWPSSAFEKFHCPSVIKFGIRIDEFSKVIKRAGTADSIEMNVQDNYLNIRTSGGYLRNYKMRLIESSASSSSPVPQMTFDSKIVLGPVILDKILADIGVISEQLTIDTNGTPDKAAIFSGTSDKGEVRVTLDDKSNIEYLHEINVNENSKSTYTIDYISKIIRAIGSQSDLITIEYSSKKPLKMQFKLGNAVKLLFYLAPRVQD